jgi:hypothetical protein
MNPMTHYNELMAIPSPAPPHWAEPAQFAQDRQRVDSELVLSYISSGIFEVASTPELASVSMLGEAIRLVAFP